MFYDINEQSNVPIQQQQLLYNGNEMRNSDKLSALGVKDDDLLMMVSNASARYGGLTSWSALFYNCAIESFIIVTLDVFGCLIQ